MSPVEKFIGIAAILIICAVFLIVMRVAIAYLGRWREKGIRPGNTFPHNPKGGGLSGEQLRALNVGAILAGTNNDFCDSLQTSKAVAKKVIQEFMARDWEISSSEEALKRLEDLKNSGNRRVSNLILKNASRLFGPGKPAALDPRSIYGLTGFSLLDDKILEEYADEVQVAAAHIDLIDEILKASSFDEIKKHQALFGDERTFSVCIKIYHRFHEQCLVYERRFSNLSETVSDLQKEGLLGTDLSELDRIDVTAWDMGRMVNVSRYSYDLGYLQESQAWEYILYALQESAARYADWAEFGKAYIIGRALWGGKSFSLFNAIGTLEKLKKDKKSPWALASLR